MQNNEFVYFDETLSAWVNPISNFVQFDNPYYTDRKLIFNNKEEFLFWFENSLDKTFIND